MGISKPIISEIAYKTYLINEFGMASCFVLLGQERGLVIDAGCGMYDIRSIVDELCPLPYDVVITHSHCDHTGCVDKWEEVWLHPADWESYLNAGMGKEMLMHYPDMMAIHGSFDVYDISKDQIRFPEKLAKPLPLEDGQIFDLGGGRKVEVIHTPGHSLGEVVFLDPSVRILFSGDACNPNLGIGATSVNTALKGLLKVKARQDDFDRNFNSHAGYGGNTFGASMPESTLDDCLHILKGILDGTADVKMEVNPFRPDGPASTSVTYGAVRIGFNPERLIDEGEEPVRF